MADWSSQNDKSRLESAEELEEINKKKDYEMTTEEGSKEEENYIVKSIRMMLSELSNNPKYSSRIDKLRLESAYWSSQIDKSRLESAEELEEMGTTEKQKVKECEKQEMTEQDTELVHQEVNNDMVAGNDETFVEILRSQDKCEEDKTYKEDTHVKKGFDYNNTENFASENDEPFVEVLIPELLEPDLRSDGHCTALNLGIESRWLGTDWPKCERSLRERVQIAK